jgi:hypothetical protein
MRQAMGGEGAGYSRGQVLSVERWAWAGKVRDGTAEYFYDGIEFWLQSKAGALHALSPRESPPQGWWHRPECDCRLCRAQGVSR